MHRIHMVRSQLVLTVSVLVIGLLPKALQAKPKHPFPPKSSTKIKTQTFSPGWFKPLALSISSEFSEVSMLSHATMTDISALARISLLVSPSQHLHLPAPSEENASTDEGSGYYVALGAFYLSLIIIGGLAVLTELVATGFVIAGLVRGSPYAWASWTTAIIGGLGFLAGIPLLLIRELRGTGILWMLLQGAILGLGVYTLTKVYAPATATNNLEHPIQPISVWQFRTAF